MRRTSVVLPLAGLVLISACGSSSSSTSSSSSAKPSSSPTSSATDYASVLRAAVAKTGSTSSRVSINVLSKTPKGDVAVTGAGVFGKTATGPVGDLTVKVMSLAIEEKITGGNIYLKVPQQAGYFVLPLSKLTGTSLGTTSSPSSAADLLLAVGKSVQKVGTTTIRGTSTTHYKGTITVDPALYTGAAKNALELLRKGGVTSVPFDAYVDGQGRINRFVEVTAITTQGVTVNVTTTLDEYDFGVPVNVTAPPKSEQKDGSALLKALQGATA